MSPFGRLVVKNILTIDICSKFIPVVWLDDLDYLFFFIHSLMSILESHVN